jgi:hypothetical protein
VKPAQRLSVFEEITSTKQPQENVDRADEMFAAVIVKHTISRINADYALRNLH